MKFNWQPALSATVFAPPRPMAWPASTVLAAWVTTAGELAGTSKTKPLLRGAGQPQHHRAAGGLCCRFCGGVWGCLSPACGVWLCSYEALAVSEAHAKQANQAKTEFLAAMSHELRTP